MASFSPRTFDQILADMIAYIQATTEISDFTPGSVIRTILEAAALEDDEQYYQMVQMLDLFSLTVASGDDLDRRLSDFNLTRAPAKGSSVKLRFYNNNLITSQLSTDAAAAATSITVFNIASFPTPSPTYNVRIGEGTGRVQDVTVNGINYGTGTLSLSTPVLFDSYLGDRVSYVSTDFYAIPLGTAVVAPATTAESAKVFTTQQPAYILPGNFYSNETLAYSQSTGSAGNVGVRRLTQFSSVAPFPGAGVINLSAATGGRDRESDTDFRSRGVKHIQSLTRGTPVSLVNATLGVTDSTTNQRVVSANIVEDYERDEVIMYIDDGTGFTPNLSQYAADSLQSPASIGDLSINLNSATGFPASGKILVLTPTGGTNEYVPYSLGTAPSYSILVLGSPLVSNHSPGDIVLVVDPITESSEAGQRRFKLQNFPVIRGTFRLFLDQGSGFTELATDKYFLNKGTGDLQLSDTLTISAGSKLVASYNFYTNLIAEVQRTLEGSLDNSNVYPGFKAAGIMLVVEAPNIKRVTVVASITAMEGFTESDLWSSVQTNIEGYINSRKIGEDVIVAKMVDVAFNVTGVQDVKISLPTSNVVVLENELAVAFDFNGNSLVTVS